MSNKLTQWLALQVAVDKHSDNASAALNALDLKPTIVNGHLLRIARREGDLSDFLMHVSESKAFDIDEDEQ